MINRELESYDQALAGKPRVVAGNKTDLAEPGRVEEIREAMAERGVGFFPISALTGEGLGELLEALSGLLRESRETGGAGAEPEPSQERTVYRFRPKSGKGFEVIREEDGFRVLGRPWRSWWSAPTWAATRPWPTCRRGCGPWASNKNLRSRARGKATPSSSGTWSSTTTPTETRTAGRHAGRRVAGEGQAVHRDGRRPPGLVGGGLLHHPGHRPPPAVPLRLALSSPAAARSSPPSSTSPRGATPCSPRSSWSPPYCWWWEGP